MTKKRSGGGGRAFVVLLIIAAIIGAAYLLNKCGGLGGFGLGAGTGTATGTASGSASAPPSASSAPPVASSAQRGAEEPFIIRVAGTTCRVGSAQETKECTEACTKADEATKGQAKREVRLSPSKGSQEVVETLKKCLQEKGVTVLEVDE